MCKMLLVVTFILIGCGSESENDESTDCNLMHYDKVGQKTECSDGGTK